MRVLALASYDSGLNIAGLIAPHFEAAGCRVDLSLVRARKRKQISDRQIGALAPRDEVPWVDLADLCMPDRIGGYDIILSTLEGLSTRTLMHHLRPSGTRRPLVVCAYSGLVLRFAHDGLSMRSASDLLWLNSEADLALYRDMCFAFGLRSDNARVLGVPALLERVARAPDAARGPVVFFEQSIIPSTRDERLFLAEQLIGLARRYPDRQVLVKPRVSGEDATLHRVRHPIGQLLDEAAYMSGGWPANLALSEERSGALLERASACLTVCSTVAAEALHAGVPTAIVADFGAHDEYGMHYFFRSGLMRRFADIELPLMLVPEPAWAARHMPPPQPAIGGLVAEAVAMAAAPRQPLSDLDLAAEMSPALRLRLGELHGPAGVVTRQHKTIPASTPLASRLYGMSLKIFARRQ
ncbi:MAG: hypothetical protein KF914_00105 [Rhizobiaceae bacterium]|nr:hypothetical protein [Rhizobiaceae bacterium]